MRSFAFSSGPSHALITFMKRAARAFRRSHHHGNCGRALPPKRSLDGNLDAVWAHPLLSSDDLCKRGKICRDCAGRAGNGNRGTRSTSSERRSALSRRRARITVRSLFGRCEHACRSDERQRHGACRVRRRARSCAACVAHTARSHFDKPGDAMGWRSLLHPSGQAQLRPRRVRSVL